MTLVHRVLFPHDIADLDEYRTRRGGLGIEAAAGLSPEEIIEVVEASGLRGRGGAGFPTGRKWRTVREEHARLEASSVVVNGAEGEPGTFKDRTILTRNPYQVVEGALIAARAVGADEIVFALKATFVDALDRVRRAIAEIEAAGWVDGVTLRVFEGPEQYLYGEETALLEVLDGRQPFPRIAPPYRRGVKEPGLPAGAHAESGLSAAVTMADTGEAPPALVDNVETVANVAHILARGAEWFRTEGTAESPGTVVCTISGQVEHAGVGEVILGTTLREAIDEIAGGPRVGQRFVGALCGVSNAVIPAGDFDTPLTYEDMAAVGSGLGSAGFILLDDSTDPVAVAAGVSRFLAVESCGQCSPCKVDGVVIADRLADLAAATADADDLATIRRRLDTVATGARCALATQHQVVVASLLDAFDDAVQAKLAGSGASPSEPELVAELDDIREGRAVWHERQRDKQPDWTYGTTWSGQAPVDRFGGTSGV